MKAIKDISIPSIGFACKAGEDLTAKKVAVLKKEPGLIKRLQNGGLLAKEEKKTAKK